MCNYIYLALIICIRKEEYIKDEMRNLKRELIRAKEVSQKGKYSNMLTSLPGIEKDPVCPTDDWTI